MKLRPHHLLCIQKFTGHGYNEAFTAHMSSVVSKLENMPAAQITVTKGCDDLCEMCPNNIGGVCTSLEKVDLMDGAVLSVCDLDYGEAEVWQNLKAKARERIFETDAFAGICAACQWYELCKITGDRSE